MRLSILFFTIFFLQTTLLLAQSFGDFRSRQSGNWSDSDTWEEYNGVTWINTTGIPDENNGAINIVSGNSVTISTGQVIIANQITIQVNGSLTIDAGATMELTSDVGTELVITSGRFGSGSLDVLGTLISNNDCVINSSITTMSINNGGVFRHNHTTSPGAIPIANWINGSRFEITGYTTVNAAPMNLNQSFYDVVWNTPNLDAPSFLLDLDGQLDDIKNDFQIVNTGNSFLVFSDGTPATINIGNDLIISGASNVDLNFSEIVTINIGGDFTINTSDGVNMGYEADCFVNLSGDFNLLSGTYTIDSQDFGFTGGTGSGFLNVGGSFSNSGNLIETGNETAQITLQGTGNIDFNNVISNSYEIDFILESGSNYNIINGYIGGSGDFTMQSNATLGLNSTSPSGALQTGTSGGNIRNSGTRSFGSNVTLIYNGSSTQSLGNGFPSSGDVNLTIDNPTEVILDQDLTINSLRTLTKQQGILDLGSVTTTISGAIVNNGGAARGNALANLIINAQQTDAFTLVEDQRLLNLTVNPGTGNNFIQGSDITVLGDFTHTSGNYVFSDHKLVLSGIVNNTSGSFTSNNNSVLVINGTGTLSAISFNSGSAIDTLTIARAGSNLTTNSSISIDVLNLTDGTFNNTGTITIADGGRVFRSESGNLSNALNATTSFDVQYTNSTDITTGVELPSTSTALDSLIFTGSGVVILDKSPTVNGAIIVNNGTFNASSFNVQLAGNLINNSNALLNGSTFTFIGNSEVQSVTPPVFGNLVVNSGAMANIASGSINIEGNLTNNGTFTSAATTNFTGTTALLGSNAVTLNDINITSGSTLTASSFETTINGAFTNDGTFDANSGTIVFGGNTSILGSSNPQFFSIRIEGTLNSPAVLDLTKDITNNGTFVAGSNTVEFNGTATQFVSGSSEIVFHDMDVNNTAGPPAVSINGLASLQGILTIANTGTVFDADGSGSGVFTVLSNASGDGGINTIPAGSSISGDVTVQRFLQSYGRSFRYFSPTVTNATVADWQDDISVTGSFTGASPGQDFHSLLFYDESILGTINEGFTEFPSTSNAESFVPGRGYTAYIWEGQSDVTVDVRGPINQGDLDLNVTYNSTGVPEDDGWNLVANAYPGVVDWQVIYDDASTQNVGPQIAVRDESSNGSFAYYDASTGQELNGGSRYIAMGQSFWVQTIGTSPSLVLSETFKSTNSATFLKTEEKTSKTIIIALSNDSQRDETSLNWTPEATFGYDPGLDFKKFNNDGFDISTLTNETKDVAINHIGTPECSKSVFLNVKDVSDGVYQLSFEGVKSFHPHLVSLVDHFSNEVYELNEDLSISFEVNTNDSTTFGRERFEILIDEVIIPKINITTLSGCNDSNGQIFIENTSDRYEYFIYDNEGNELFTATGNNSSVFFELAPEQHDTDLSVYMNSIGCDNRILVENATVTRNIIEPEIIQEGNLLTSNYSEGNQWYYEGELLTNENNQSLVVDKQGVYKLEVIQGSCSSFIEYEYRVTSIEFNTKEISVYPNPFNNMFSIILDDNWAEPEITLYRNDGVMISSRSYLIDSNGVINIYGKDLIQGVYHLVIKENNKVVKRKIVKL